MAVAMALGACNTEALPRQADRVVSEDLVVAPLAFPGDVAYVARGTVAEELRFNGTVDVLEREGVAAPISGLLTGALPTSGTQMAKGDVLFSVAPEPGMRAAAAELEAALLAQRLGTGDPAQVEARVTLAMQTAEEMDLPIDDRALEPLPAAFDVLAPIAGTVLVSHPPEGGQTIQGDVLVEIGDTADLVVTATVPGLVAKSVDVGTAVIIATKDGRGSPLEGTIIAIVEPEEGEGDDVPVTLVIDLAIDVLEFGTGVRVAITGASHQDVLWLPPGVIRSHNGTTFVIVDNGETARRVEVVLGVQTDEQVEVGGFLVEGQKVVGP
ncbi:MAG: efflux RND transporter periplasmic adaptor subunit [Acidimicrobiia bacterium]